MLWPQCDHKDDDIVGDDDDDDHNMITGMMISMVGIQEPHSQAYSSFGPQRPFLENGPSHKLLKFWSEKTVDKIDKRPKWGWMDGIKAGSSVQSLFSFYVSQSFQTVTVTDMI